MMMSSWFTGDFLPILVGALLGLAVYYAVVNPWQLRNHERKRRALGLPPKRRLPEDR